MPTVPENIQSMPNSPFRGVFYLYSSWGSIPSSKEAFAEYLSAKEALLFEGNEIHR
jgi:hypothetical protein